MAYEDTSSVRSSETNAPVVVGLFASADDAHRAVTQLRSSGFSPNQIGAAFRHRSTFSSREPGPAGSAVGSVDDRDRERESWWDKLKDAFRPVEAGEHHRRTSEPRELENTSIPPERNLEAGDYDRDYEYDFADSEMEGSLAGTGIPSDRAAYLIGNLKPGGAIVTVHDPARVQEAESILSANGARVRYEGVTGPNGSLEEGAAASQNDADIADRANRSPLDSSLSRGDRVQLFGEVLRVHKERIRRGEARLRKDVVTENQTVEVPVTHEELVLERVAVPGDTPAPSANIGESTEVRIPLSGENVRVEKQPVVREEVIVGKREVTNVETVGDNVRREELRVDDDSADKRGPAEDRPGNLRRPA